MEIHNNEVIEMNFFYRNYGKRLIDIVLSCIALIILAPLLIIIGVLVYFKLGSPILFTQERPGKNGEIFKLYKFRSMTDEKDETGKLLPDSIRLTKFGKFLRLTSLDELPELWNILIGDMSIVGPRPLLVQYLPLYNNHQKRRHDVRPGLTGYAQVNGRNAISWQEKFNYDVDYVDKVNFLLDTQIVFKTIKQVSIKDGISSENSSTMEAFKGNGNE